MTPTAPTPLDIRLFGSWQVRVEGQSIPPLRSRKGQYLLALLTLRHDRPLERAWLAGTLWPESSEEQALFNLRQCLSNLRQALGVQASRLRSPTAHTLTLDLNGANVDVISFNAALARGEVASLQEAVNLYRGPLLEGCTEEWVLPERQAREQAYLSALEQLAEQALQVDAPQRAAGYLRAVIGVDPLRESAQRGLLQALAASGDYAAMVLVFRDLRLLLRRELNTDPDPQTTALYHRLRRQARLDAQTLSSELSPSAAATASAVSPPAELALLEAEPSLLTLTLLFTDIVSSTHLWEQHPEAMRQALKEHDRLLRQTIEAHHGQVFKTVGDAFCAVFPTAQDALAAALAAQLQLNHRDTETQRQDRGGEGEKGRRGDTAESSQFSVPSSLPSLPFSLQVRMALHSGTVEARDGDYFGPTVNRVAGLLSLGHGRQILLSAPTRELLGERLPPGVQVSELGPHRLKGVDQPQLVFQALHPDLPQEFPPLRSRDTLPHNLPVSLTPFIGREAEIEQVQQLLSRARLVTLTGAGGCGKTRLALQVAEKALEGYPDGVWLVELAALTDPTLVASSVLKGLGVREEAGRTATETLCSYLGSRQTLLLLDNCEHLVETCAQLVSTLLRACPHLKVLVTSQEALQIAGEQPWRVPPMQYPAADQLPSEEKDLAGALLEYDACRLFVERARVQQPGFVLTRSNAIALVQLCRHLDGLPLALELAAARIRVLSLEQIVARLEDRFRLLRGADRTALPRHQTLQALIDWSYELLKEPERLLLQRLSVFAGGWSLEAAEQVTGNREQGTGQAFSVTCNLSPVPSHEVLDLLTSLVDKSLVVVEESGGSVRYRMSETVRVYGREKLRASGEEMALRNRHLEWYLTLAEEAESKLTGPEQGEWLERLEMEHDNFRLALQGCLEEGRGGEGEKGRRGEAEPEDQSKIHNPQSKIEEGLRLTGALSRFWYVRGYWSEGKGWLDRTLSKGASLPGADRVKSLVGAAHLAYSQGDLTQAQSLLEESLAIYRQVEDRRGIASTLQTLAVVARGRGRSTEAYTLLEESLALRRELADQAGIANVSIWLGILARDRQDYTTARKLFIDSLAIYRGEGNQAHIADALNMLGLAAQEEGDYAAAQPYYEQSLAIRRTLGDMAGLAKTLDNLGNLARARSDYLAARRAHEESLAIEQELGDEMGAAATRCNLGWVLALLGDYAQARTHLQDSLRYYGNVEDKSVIPECLEGLAAVVQGQGQSARAVRLLGASHVLRQTLQAPLTREQQTEQERQLATVRAALSEESFAEEWTCGEAMTVEEAVEYGLAEPGV